jgi:HK97 family phage portal protein
VGLLSRVNAALAETRAFGVPWEPWTDPLVRFDVGGPVHPSRAGRAGIDAALRLQPVYSSVRILAEGAAQLPIRQYRDTGDRKIKMPLGQLLTKPSAYLNRFDWIFQYISSAALTGTAWGLITARDGYGFPTTVEWLPPDRMFAEDSEPFNPAKTRIYFAGRQVNRNDLLIIRAFTVPGRTAGISPLRQFQLLIEQGVDALAYGADWYKAGGFPPGTFQNSQYEVDDQQAAMLKKRLVQSMRRREPLVYGRDWEYKPISVPPDEAQFVQAMQLNATQVASIYGVPPWRVGGTRGDSMTYANVESEALEFVTDSLDPWLYRFEAAMEDCLPAQQSAQFDRNARLRMTPETRYGVYKTARDMGMLTPNEIRELEDLPPLQGGIGDDPLPLEVLVAMARGIKEIPKSFETLVTESPADELAREQAVTLAKEAAKAPAAPPPPVYPEQGGAPASNGKSSPNGSQPSPAAS